MHFVVTRGSASLRANNINVMVGKFLIINVPFARACRSRYVNVDTYVHMLGPCLSVSHACMQAFVWRIVSIAIQGNDIDGGISK